jgi:hypothetical protein
MTKKRPATKCSRYSRPSRNRSIVPKA